ncbi:MAG: hypothetical protein MHMPM18_004837 [Marteilia pararefringens]
MQYLPQRRIYEIRLKRDKADKRFGITINGSRDVPNSALRIIDAEWFVTKIHSDL